MPQSPLLRPTLEKLARYGFNPPERMTIPLDAGYDSNVTRELLDELSLDGHIQPKGVVVPINHTRRWVVERTNSWHGHSFTLVAVCTERRARVINAFNALIAAIIIT